MASECAILEAGLGTNKQSVPIHLDNTTSHDVRSITGSIGFLASDCRILEAGLGINEQSLPIYLDNTTSYDVRSISSSIGLPASDESRISILSKEQDELVRDINGVDATYTFQTHDSYLTSFPFGLPPLPERRSRLAKFQFQISSAYRRLFSIVFMANMIALIMILTRHHTITAVFNAVAANLTVNGLTRLPHVINQVYKITTCIPPSAPLPLRSFVARVSHYGGIHSGCGVAALVWYLGVVVRVTADFATPESQSYSVPVLVLLYLMLLLLAAIIIAAHPKLRSKNHNIFEFTHRYATWTLVALFWAVMGLFASHRASMANTTTARYLATFPAFWLTIITTLAVVLPWLSLRRVPVTSELLSSHAIRLHFTYTYPGFCQGISISRRAIFHDWHSFASIPDTGEPRGFSLIVSNAGDWTSSLIRNPPSHLWKRNIPSYSFIQAMLLFRRCLLVVTGSGIGPCLSLGSAPNLPPLRVLWQARSPMRTYGKEVLHGVRRMDPNAMIIDTDVGGRRDMLPIAWDMVQKHGAEVVFVVANPKVVRDITLGFEARGVTAYGPVFDS